MEKEMINNRIDKIINSLNISEPIDTVHLANIFNFKVVEDENIIPYGMLSINKENIIYIKDYLSIEMKRYVITYLLSYYLLYYNNSNQFLKLFMPNNEIEEVSYMSRKLLLNDKVFIIKYKELNQNVEKLSSLFNVPRNVVEKRINDITPSFKRILKNN